MVGLGFTPTLWVSAPSRLARGATLPFVAALVGVAGVGLFPAGTPLHFPAAAMAYLGFILTPLLFGVGSLVAGARRPGGVSLLDGLVHLFSWVVWGIVLSDALPGLAVPEVVGAVLFDGWVLWVAHRAWRDR